jgi:hypothetical protein
MSLPLKTPGQVRLIVSSFRNVFQQNEISKLSKSAYNFIYLCSGFIAHYDVYGFRGHYADVESLKQDILRNQSMNQWRNFRPGERDYEYMMQKKEIYNMIVEEVEEANERNRRDEKNGLYGALVDVAN